MAHQRLHRRGQLEARRRSLAQRGAVRRAVLPVEPDRGATSGPGRAELLGPPPHRRQGLGPGLQAEALLAARRHHARRRAARRRSRLQVRRVADVLAYRPNKCFTGNPVFNFRARRELAHVRSRPSFGFGDPDVDDEQPAVRRLRAGRLVDRATARAQPRPPLGRRDEHDQQRATSRRSALADSLRGVLNGQFCRRPADLTPAALLRVPQARHRRSWGASTTTSRPAAATARSTGRRSSRAWAPRTTCSATGSTVLFGGVGIYFDRNYWNTLLDEQFRRQFRC